MVFEKPPCSNNVDSITKSVIDLPARNCNDAGLELTAPKSFSYSRFSSDSSVERTWSVYEWNGGFVRRTYTAKLRMSARSCLTPARVTGRSPEMSGPHEAVMD